MCLRGAYLAQLISTSFRNSLIPDCMRTLRVEMSSRDIDLCIIPINSAFTAEPVLFSMISAVE